MYSCTVCGDVVDLCPHHCTMCDIRDDSHQGTLTCPTCDCCYCNLHVDAIAQYGGCPSCFMGDDPCIVCGGGGDPDPIFTSPRAFCG